MLKVGLICGFWIISSGMEDMDIVVFSLILRCIIKFCSKREEVVDSQWNSNGLRDIFHYSGNAHNFADGRACNKESLA